MRKTALIMIVAVLAGCTTYAQQKQLARENQWEQVGLLDGQKGYHQKGSTELTQYGQASDSAINEYRQGYEKGITEFCQPETAFKRGLSGTIYKGQCAGLSNENEVVTHWQKGLNKHRVNQAITTAYERK